MENGMRLVYRATVGAPVHVAKHLLEHHGIPCIIKNEHFSLTAPPIAISVELWVLSDADEAEARRLLDAPET
jgi:hypothetical protein